MINFSMQSIPTEIAYSNGVKDFVVEPTTEDKIAVASLLQFSEMPSREEIINRSEEIADIVGSYGEWSAAFGNVPPFMVTELENVLFDRAEVSISYPLMESVPKTLNIPDGTSSTKITHELRGFTNGIPFVAIPKAASPVSVTEENEGKILNVTKGDNLPPQVTANMVEPSDKERLLDILSPGIGEQTHKDLKIRAVEAAYIIKGEGCDRVAVDSIPPSLVSAFGTALQSVGIQVVYPFTSTTITRNNDGERSVVTKDTKFEGFIEEEPNECADSLDALRDDDICTWEETLQEIGETDPRIQHVDNDLDEDEWDRDENGDDDDDVGIDELRDEFEGYSDANIIATQFDETDLVENDFNTEDKEGQYDDTYDYDHEADVDEDDEPSEYDTDYYDYLGDIDGGEYED